MEEVDIPGEVREDSVSIAVERLDDGARVTTVAQDRVGLLADFAAMFALQRIPVRAARVWSQSRTTSEGEQQVGVSVWEVASDEVDEAILRTKFEAITAGRLDVRRRFEASTSDLAPSVVVRPDASEQATVLEVRAADRVGVVYLVCAALAELDVAVRSAHVDTLGPQAVDVFYLQEAAAGALSETRAAQAAHPSPPPCRASAAGRPCTRRRARWGRSR